MGEASLLFKLVLEGVGCTDTNLPGCVCCRENKQDFLSYSKQKTKRSVKYAPKTLEIVHQKAQTMAYTGFEPVTFALLARRSNQLS